MNNGLQGRYQSQLETWNRARTIAAEMRDAFFNSGSINEVLGRHGVTVPNLGEIKNALFSMAASSGRELVDPVAHLLYEVLPESSEMNNQRQRVSV